MSFRCSLIIFNHHSWSIFLCCYCCCGETDLSAHPGMHITLRRRRRCDDQCHTALRHLEVNSLHIFKRNSQLAMGIVTFYLLPTPFAVIRNGRMFSKILFNIHLTLSVLFLLAHLHQAKQYSFFPLLSGKHYCYVCALDYPIVAGSHFICLLSFCTIQFLSIFHLVSQVCVYTRCCC